MKNQSNAATQPGLLATGATAKKMNFNRYCTRLGSLILVAFQINASGDEISQLPPEVVVSQSDVSTIRVDVTTPRTAFITELQRSADLSNWTLIKTIDGGDVVDNTVLAIDGESPFFRAVTQHRPGDLGDLWCLGDSFVQCWQNTTWRRKLSQDLDAAGWAVDFVGTLTSPASCETGQEFDREHNGIGGITAEEVLTNRLPGWLDAVTPDTVLIQLGGNDFQQGATLATIEARLESIVDQIRNDNPNVVIYIGNYGYSFNFPDSIGDLAAESYLSLVENKTTAQSPVYFVDHRIGWDKTIHMDVIDGQHPTDAGMQKIAENWLAAIELHQSNP